MTPASLKDIKQALAGLDQKQLVAACLRLAKFKKDNKELLTYLLFESENETAYVNSVKEMLDEQFAEINLSSLFFVKKSLRKIVRTASRFIRYSDDPSTEPEVLIHVVEKMIELGLDFRKSTALENIYLSLLKKIQKSVAKLHEDLQFDYEKRMAVIERRL